MPDTMRYPTAITDTDKTSPEVCLLLWYVVTMVLIAILMGLSSIQIFLNGMQFVEQKHHLTDANWP
jgi:uncharacterized membrane protein